jgi:hypothetical protein
VRLGGKTGNAQAEPVIVFNEGDTLWAVPQDDIESVSGSGTGVV